MTTSMLEKLTRHYMWCEQLGIKGHAVGYYAEKFELIKAEYEFPNGKFTLKRKTETFFLWHYDGKNQA